MWNTKPTLSNGQNLRGRTVRARQLADGHFEFLEPVQLVESEFEVTIVEKPVLEKKRTGTSALPPAWNMGVLDPLHREDIYEDNI